MVTTKHTMRLQSVKSNDCVCLYGIVIPPDWIFDLMGGAADLAKILLKCPEQHINIQHIDRNVLRHLYV